MNRSRKRALRSPQNDETMLGGTTGAGNPALTDPSPTPPTCGLKHSQTCRAKSETPHCDDSGEPHAQGSACPRMSLLSARIGIPWVPVEDGLALADEHPVTIDV
jgi:hypothetical protein